MTDTPRTTRTPADQAWCDAFVVELRLRDAPGAAIGAALAEVDSHCADAGCGPREAFGDPAEYARALALPEPTTRRHGSLAAVATGLLTTAGTGLLLGGVWAGADGMRVTAGELATLVLVVALVIAVATSGSALRALVTAPFWRVWLVGTAAMAAAVAPAALWRTDVATLPRGAALVAGGVLLVAAALTLLRVVRASADPVVAPGGSAPLR
jgi:hypothetical protein